MADDTARAWAYLSRVAEPPCPELATLVARVGAVEAADRIRRGAVGGELARLPRPGARSTARQKTWTFWGGWAAG